MNLQQNILFASKKFVQSFEEKHICRNAGRHQRHQKQSTLFQGMAQEGNNARRYTTQNF